MLKPSNTPVSEKDQKEVVDMIQSAIDMGYEDFKQVFKENQDIFGSKMMTRGRIQKHYPTLLKQRQESISSRYRLDRIKEYELNITEDIKRNKQMAKYDIRTKDDDHEYYIIKKYYLKDDQCITIGMPYSTIDKSSRTRATKYAFTMNIYKSLSPKIFENTLSKLKYI